MIRIAHFVTHPIQYFAPLYRTLTRSEGVDLTVFFGSDFGTKPSFDPGLSSVVQFDTPLLEGFRFEFLNNQGDGQPGGNPASFDCPDLRPCLGSRNFDVVWIHGWGYRFQRQAADVAESLRLPYLLRGESTLIEAPFLSLRWIRRFVLHHRMIKSAARCLYVGYENRRFFRSFGVPAARLIPAHYSIDVDFFRSHCLSEADGIKFRARHGIDERSLVVVTVAKLIPRKRVADIIEAIALCPSHVHLWVLGEGWQSETLKKLAEQVAPNRVKWFGFTNQRAIPGILSSADVFVLASDEETWGLVVNEAMACGLPAIVSSKVGCSKDLVIAGETGFVYSCGDVALLAEAMQRLLADKATLTRMKESAFQRVALQYSVDATAHQIIEGVRQVAQASVY